MQTLSKVELAFLAVIGYPELTSKALKLCADKVILFDRNSYPHVSMMWSAYLNTLKRYKKKFGLKVSPDLIAGDLSEAVSNDEDMPEEIVSSCDTILNRLVSGKLPTREEGLELIQSLVVLDTNRKISAQVLKNADLEAIQKTLDSSRRVMTTLDNSEDLNKGRILFNPFSDIQQLAKHVVRIPTGINFLDIASSGGGRSQELWLLLGPSSGGKCFCIDTPVLMYDGSIKMVQDVNVGDQLMGPDSTPRTVLSLARGTERLYKIVPAKGAPYTVTGDHYLCLTPLGKNIVLFQGRKYKKGDILDITVHDYMAMSQTFKNRTRMIRTGVVFPARQDPELDPYFVGLYLGDGSNHNPWISNGDHEVEAWITAYVKTIGYKTKIRGHGKQNCVDIMLSMDTNKEPPFNVISRNIYVDGRKEKRILPAYKLGSRKTRLSVLAGLLDTDGYMHHSHLEIATKYDGLAEDILFVARSLGFAAYDNYGEKACTNNGAKGMYHRITISGDLTEVPFKVPRRVPNKPSRDCNALAVKFQVTSADVADYYGFTTDGDHRFLLGDFTVTHNSMFSVQYSAAQALMGNNTLWVTYEQSMEGDLAERLIANVTDCSLDEIRDIGFDNLSQDIQTKFWAAVNGSEERLKVLDMTRMEFDKDDPADDSGIYSVWKRIKELKAEGWSPKTVLIDWFGAMMSMVGTITGQDLSKAYRFLAQHQIDIARKMVKDEDLMCIFTHQTDMQTQHAKPTYAPDKTNSKDMKDLCNYMDIVLTLGNRDKNDIQYFNAAKARKGSAVLQTVQMIGEKARFKKVEGWLPNRDGNFYNPSEAYTSDDDEDDALNETARSYSREIL